MLCAATRPVYPYVGQWTSMCLVPPSRVSLHNSVRIVCKWCHATSAVTRCRRRCYIDLHCYKDVGKVRRSSVDLPLHSYNYLHSNSTVYRVPSFIYTLSVLASGIQTSLAITEYRIYNGTYSMYQLSYVFSD